MKIYGHPWSINTRKTLMTLAEKGHEAELVMVVLPKGEHKQPAHLARHPFGKVPVLEDDGHLLYETRAINLYLDAKLDGARLIPSDAWGSARMHQWMSIADAAFIPHVHPFLVEALFRRHLGGAQDVALMESASGAMQPVLDVADAWLAQRPYFAGENFSLADIQWMPYLEYLLQSGHRELFARGSASTDRKHLLGWWDRVSARPAWHRVARGGSQAYDAA